MIEKLFKSNSPIVLENSYLLVDKNPIPLTRSFVFFKSKFLKVTKVGEDRILNHIKQEESIQGYFYSNHPVLALMSRDIDEKEIILIGNKTVKGGEVQYQIKGLSIEKTKDHMGNNSYMISKFSALEHEVIYLPEEGNIE